MLLTCVDLLYIITDVCLTDIIVAVVVFEDHTVKQNQRRFAGAHTLSPN